MQVQWIEEDRDRIFPYVNLLIFIKHFFIVLFTSIKFPLIPIMHLVLQKQLQNDK